MKKVLWLSLFWLLADGAFGQHRVSFVGGGVGLGGFVPGGFGHGRFGHPVVIRGFGFPQQVYVNLGIPPLAPIAPLGINAPVSLVRGPFFPSALYPYALPVFGAGYDYGYAPAQNVIIIQPPAPVIQQRPPEKVRPEIHEYRPTAPPGPAPSAGEQRAFAIALRDGSTHSAIAASVENNMLLYVDPDGRHRRTPLDSIDRESTRKLNREKQLDLWLPPLDDK